VNIDYNVEFDGYFYSVPHRLVRTEVELRVSGTTVEAFTGQQRVAVHPYSAVRATSPPSPLTCRRRIGRTWSGRQPS
jgi:hypothetical protein